MQDDVDDIVKLVAAAGLSTPMVVAAHSYGGLIADLLARTHPELVNGLVLVDPLSEFLPRLGRPEQDAAFNRAARVPTPELDGEGFLAVDAYARIKLAPPLPKVPTIVLSSDKFPPPADLGPDDYTKFQIHQANSLLAETLLTENVIIPGTGHNIMLYAPQVVAGKIIVLVDRIRSAP
jgi:pimeloyl-ACP methyl ester carboxylesterase